MHFGSATLHCHVCPYVDPSQCPSRARLYATRMTTYIPWVASKRVLSIHCQLWRELPIHSLRPNMFSHLVLALISLSAELLLGFIKLSSNSTIQVTISSGTSLLQLIISISALFSDFPKTQAPGISRRPYILSLQNRQAHSPDQKHSTKHTET